MNFVYKAYIYLVILCLTPMINIHAETGSLLVTDPIVFHENQFFVLLEEGIMEDTVLAFLEDLNSTEVWKSGHLNLALWEVEEFPFTSGGETLLDINAVIARSRKKTKIHGASLNIQQQITSHSVAALNGVSCFDIADYSHTQGDSSTILISILDTGIEPIADNTNLPSYNYNLTSYSGYDYIHNDNIPDDENGHGTHLVGIIHSITHHLTDPMQSRVEFDIRKTHNSEGKAFMSAVVIAMVDALAEGADIINLSFGYTDVYHDSIFFPLKIVVEEAEKDDVLVVIAAGNEYRDNDQLDSTALPSSFPVKGAISVTSLNCENTLSTFANYGSQQVDIGVLGELIPGPDMASGIVELSGTSQAAAIVTAIAAIRGTHLEDFHPLKIICPLLSTSTHYLDLTDRVVSSGKLLPSQLYSSVDTTCFIENFNCAKDFTGISQLSGIQNQNDIIETDLAVESIQQLSVGTENTYDAKAVSLLPGFEVPFGASMQIQTNGCDN